MAFFPDVWAALQGNEGAKPIFDTQQQQGALGQLGQQLRTLSVAPSIQSGAQGNRPSALQEWEYFSRLPKEKQLEYLTMKRAQPVLNQGNQFGAYNPLTQQVAPVAPINPRVAETPEYKAAQQEAVKDVDLVKNPQIAGSEAAARLQQELAYKPPIEQATTEARASGERSATKQAISEKIPSLENTILKLDELGKKATYSLAGRATDVLAKEVMGNATEGSKARQEYINTAKDQLYPILKATFGAQFTQKEGEALLGTLGDPNLHPEQKTAVLGAFIRQKYMDVDPSIEDARIANGSIYFKKGGKWFSK